MLNLRNLLSADFHLPRAWPSGALVAPGFLLASLVACGGAEDRSPRIESFTVSPTSAKVGDTVTLCAVFANGTGSVDPGVGPLASGGTATLVASRTTTFTLTVNAGDGTARQATATLAVDPGLLVSVDGLPAGVDAPITLQGPDGSTREIRRSAALPTLTSGTYTLKADSFTRDGVTYHPLRAAQTVVIGTSGEGVRVIYPKPVLSVPLPTGASMDFVLIPSGAFEMGPVHPEQTLDWPRGGDSDTASYALPRHRVTFAKAFYLGRFPVTIRQWVAVVGETTPDYASKDPEVAVWNRSWVEARFGFLPALRAVAPPWAFRLPSEAEWEYAVRAGSTTKYFWGDDPSGIDEYAWTYATTVSAGNLWPKVGLKRPNKWGVQDMFSVYQWLDDDGHLDYQGAPTDGSSWLIGERGSWVLARGSAWSHENDPQYFYTFDSAFRPGFFSPFQEGNNFGIRVALDIED